MTEETKQAIDQNGHLPDQELKQCLAEVDRLSNEVNRYKNQYAYALADLDNLRKRYDKERAQIMQGAQMVILRDLVAVVDDFDRIFDDMRQAGTKDSRLEGFEFVYKALHKLLATYGVEEITQLQNFDPEVHEAISYESAAGKESGSIIAVLEKGYRFKGMVLRPAKVSVAQ
jgi:molecular chaperone GrpE